MSVFPFDAVLFDCDGVLVDSEPITNRVLAEMLGELGWPLTTEASMRIFTGKAVKDEAALIEDLGLLRTKAEPVDGAPEAVRTLHRLLDGRIACASGADRHKVELQLAKAAILDCFAGRIFSGHETPRSKPFPDVYLAAAAALDVDPARCAIVEDTVTGAVAGVAAGATVFGYSPPGVAGLGHSDPESMRAAGVAQVFTDMAQLPAILAAWRGAAT